MDSSARMMQILRFMAVRNERFTTRQLANQFDLSTSTIGSYMSPARANGWVTQSWVNGSTAGYRITDRGREVWS